MDEPKRHGTEEQAPSGDAPPPTEEATAPNALLPTRRAVIASIAGLVGAALAKSALQPEEAAAACEPLASDCTNIVVGTTELTRQLAPSSGPLLKVSASDFTAVDAHAAHGVAVFGLAGDFSGATATLTLSMRSGGTFYSDAGSGVLGVHAPGDFTSLPVEQGSTSPAGVTGISAAGAGVIGWNCPATSTLTGLRLGSGGLGSASGGVGVLGLQGEFASFNGATATSSWGAALVGLSERGTGVFGATVGATGTGVVAYNPGGYALRVAGSAAFSTMGEGVIPPSVLEHDVQDTSVRSNSHITVTFTSATKKLFVMWVEIVEGFGFRLHLSKKQKVPVSFSYLLLDREGEAS